MKTFYWGAEDYYFGGADYFYGGAEDNYNLGFIFSAPFFGFLFSLCPL